MINVFERLKFRSFFLWLLFSMLAMLVAFSPGGDLEHWSELTQLEFNFLAELALYISVALWLFFKFAFARINPAYLFGQLPPDFRFRSVIALTVPLILLSLGLINLTLAAFPEFFSQTLENIADRFTPSDLLPTLSPLISFILVVLLAPFFEEVLFRGVLLHRWATKWSLKTSVILTTILFAVLHPQDIIGSAVFSLVLTLVYLRTRTLYIPIFVHGLNNLFSFIPTFFSGPEGAELTLTPAELRSLALQGVVLLVISVPWLLHITRKHWSEEGFELPYFANTRQEPVATVAFGDDTGETAQTHEGVAEDGSTAEQMHSDEEIIAVYKQPEGHSIAVSSRGLYSNYEQLQLIPWSDISSPAWYRSMFSDDCCQIVFERGQEKVELLVSGPKEDARALVQAINENI